MSATSSGGDAPRLKHDVVFGDGLSSPGSKPRRGRGPSTEPGTYKSADQIKYLIERRYVRARVQARVPAGALVHALRHTFATPVLHAGADVVELQTLLGHESLETTRRYLDATAEGLREVIKGHPGQPHCASR